MHASGIVRGRLHARGVLGGSSRHAVSPIPGTRRRPLPGSRDGRAGEHARLASRAKRAHPGARAIARSDALDGDGVPRDAGADQFRSGSLRGMAGGPRRRCTRDPLAAAKRACAADLGARHGRRRGVRGVLEPPIARARDHAALRLIGAGIESRAQRRFADAEVRTGVTSGMQDPKPTRDGNEVFSGAVAHAKHEARRMRRQVGDAPAKCRVRSLEVIGHVRANAAAIVERQQQLDFASRRRNPAPADLDGLAGRNARRHIERHRSQRQCHRKEGNCADEDEGKNNAPRGAMTAHAGRSVAPSPSPRGAPSRRRSRTRRPDTRGARAASATRAPCARRAVVRGRECGGAATPTVAHTRA